MARTHRPNASPLRLAGTTFSSGDIVATAPNPTPSQLSVYRYRQTNKSYTENLGDGVSLTLMLIPAGEFVMGAPEEEPESEDSERPQHRVQLSQFLLGRYPITQAQWRVIAGYDRVNRALDPDPSSFKGAQRPVETVNWEEVQEFCQRLSAKTGKTYRLPSEARWEYACRAGTEALFHFGETMLPELANYDTEASYEGSPTAKSRGETTAVGSFPANEWGLHDMHGNVWEWCEDDYHNTYDGAPDDGSAWVKPERTRSSKLLRGGSWLNDPGICRSASRFNYSRGYRFGNIGLRVCCVPPVGLSVVPARTLS